MTTDKIQLHSISVVIAAKHHNPSILNKDFLAYNRIVPKSWSVVESISTPAVSTIKYSNGVEWIVDQDRLTVAEGFDIPFHQNEDTEVHNRAIEYVQILPHTPYMALGLNCVVSITHKNPDGWITGRFLDKSMQEQGIVMYPKFLIKISNAVVLNIGIGTNRVEDDEERANRVVANCNIHYKGPFEAKTLVGKISEWADIKDVLYGRIKTLLEAA